MKHPSIKPTMVGENKMAATSTLNWNLLTWCQDKWCPLRAWLNSGIGKSLLVIVLVVFGFSLCEAATIDVTDYGANPNDGTDDKAAIQNAINAGVSGDTIYFPSGTFLIGGTLAFNPNLTYLGQTGAILSETHSSTFVASTVYNNGVNITITNLVFDKGGFSFAGASYTASNVNMLHCTFRNITSTNYPQNEAMYIPIGLKNSQICNNLFTNITAGNNDVGNTGIFAWHLESVQINDNWFDMVDEGVHLEGSDTNVTVLRNTGVHLHRMGVECRNTHVNLLVQDNHFSHWVNNYYNSFGVSVPLGNGSTNNVCRDNTVLARPLTGNPQSSHYAYGIECSRVTARDNFIEGYWSVGISIGGPYCLITNNTLRGPEDFNQYTHPLFIQFNPGSNPTNTTTVINNTQINTSSYIEPPAKLTAVASSPSSVELTWSDDSDNETGFKVERKVLGGNYAVVATLGANVTSYNDTSVSSETQYVYRIQPYNDNDKTYSHVVLVATPAQSSQSSTYEAENAVLSGVAASSVNSGYTGTGYGDYQNSSGDYIEWTANAASAGTYQLVFRYANGGTGDRPLELKVNGVVVNGSLSFPLTSSWTTWLTVTNNATLNAGNNTVRLTDIGSSGGNLDNLQVIATGGGSPPPVPTGLSATAGNAQVTLAWSASSGATSYNVYRGTSPGGESGTPIATGITMTGYTNTGLANGATYYYTVAAVNDFGTSDYSSEASATPTGGVSGSLSGSVAAAASSYNLTTLGTSDWAHWNGTFIHKSTGGTQISDVSQIGGGTYGTWHDTLRSISWSDGTPTGSGTDDNYYIWCNGTADSGWTFTAPADTSSRTLHIICGGPSGSTIKFTAHLSDGSAADYTDTESGASLFTKEYTITYHAASASKVLTITIIHTNSGSPSCDLDAAWLTAGGGSSPAAPAGLSATPGNAQVSLSWNSSSGATSYNVKRSTASDNETTITNVSGTSYTDTGLANDTTYYYVVSALNGNGESDNSSEVNATPAASAPSMQLWMPLSDASGSTTSSSDTSGGGIDITMNMTTNGTVAGDLHGNIGSGINGTRALDLTTNMGNFQAGGDGGAGNVLNVSDNTALATLGNSGILNNFTISFWMKQKVRRDTTGNAPRLWILNGGNAFHSYGADNTMGMWIQATNQMDFFWNTASPLAGTASTGFPTNQWLFFAVTYDGTTFKMYYGNDASSATQIGSVTSADQSISLGSSACLSIGNRSTDFRRNFNGWMQDFRIYNGVGDSSFIENIRKATALPAAPTGLSATPGDAQMSLSWNASGGATSYNVKRSTASGDETTITNVNGTSYTDTGLANGTTYYYVVSSLNSNGESGNSSEVSTTPVGLASPWQNEDIGSVGVTGSAGYSNGVFTVSGSGTDIFSTADSFQFVYQSSGTNCAITARVASQQNTDPWAKAGVMIRETLNDNSVFAMMCITPGNGFRFMDRTSTGAGTPNSIYGGALAAAPNDWVKLTRTNNLFTAFESTNGITWTQVVSTNITMANSVYIGLEVCSHNNSATSTATFDNVTAKP